MASAPGRKHISSTVMLRRTRGKPLTVMELSAGGCHITPNEHSDRVVVGRRRFEK
jgi:hypothetical protein